MKIVIGNDHAGPRLKKVLLQHLESLGHEVINVGVDSEERVDYPDIAYLAAQEILNQRAQLGILICGTGLGISIAANKIKGIRCGSVSEATSAHLAREHNNCQMIALGARIVGDELAKDIVNSFINATFESNGRHEKRVCKIMALE